ncbi:MAG: TonB family protein, partial [Gammaproteobacteria bacterium]
TDVSSTPQQLQPTTQQAVSTTSRSTHQQSRQQPEPSESKAGQPEETALSLIQQSLEIASLEAQLREKRQAYAKRPRKRTLTELSTKASLDAAYLDAWRRKIENVGNAHYETLGIGNLTGNLRLLVAVNSNGTINDVRILQSSGTPTLDEAALQIVRLSAPFEAFPKPIHESTDVLEIIRTWRFEKGNYLSSSHQR